MTDVPTCRWRAGELQAGHFGCTSPKLVVSAAGVTAAVCQHCYCRDHEPLLVTSAGDSGPGPGPKQPLPVVPRALPCRQWGGELRETQCPTCRGQVRVKVFRCEAHRECTVARSIAGFACCALCPDYDPGAASGDSAP